MANRATYQFEGTFEPGVVKVFAEVAFGATGAPTLTYGEGIKSVTRTDTGDYTFVFGTSSPAKTDKYKRLLAFNYPTAAVTASSQVTFVPVSDDSLTGSVDVTAFSGASATDPSNGSSAYFEFTLKNSGA